MQPAAEQALASAPRSPDRRHPDRRFPPCRNRPTPPATRPVRCNTTPARCAPCRSHPAQRPAGSGSHILTPAVSLCRLIVTPQKGNSARLGGHAASGVRSGGALGVIGCDLRVAALADENWGSAGDVDTHWCGRARLGVWRGGLGCRWIVAREHAGLCPGRGPSGPTPSGEGRLTEERRAPWRSCSTGSPVWMSARTR